MDPEWLSITGASCVYHYALYDIIYTIATSNTVVLVNSDWGKHHIINQEYIELTLLLGG